MAVYDLFLRNMLNDLDGNWKRQSRRTNLAKELKFGERTWEISVQVGSFLKDSVLFFGTSS